MGSATTQQTYASAGPSEGGHLVVKATVGSFTDKIVAYIVGPPGPSPDIPYSDITSRLTTLYQNVTIANNPGDPVFSPATSELMSQVAQLESSLLQFRYKGRYSVGAFWPTESPQTTNPTTGYVTPQGAHIGLTQVPVSMPDAWDWLHNTQDGVNLFQTKLSTGYSVSVTIRKLHLAPPANTILPALTSCQLEEMALALYGPFASKLPANLYYSAYCSGGTGISCTNGSWQWKINTATHKAFCATCYVSDIRSSRPLINA